MLAILWEDGKSEWKDIYLKSDHFYTDGIFFFFKQGLLKVGKALQKSMVGLSGQVGQVGWK
jgi:hypothetical protein